MRHDDKYNVAATVAQPVFALGWGWFVVWVGESKDWYRRLRE